MRAVRNWVVLTWIVFHAGTSLGGDVFSIANSPQSEISISVAFDGTNYLVGIWGDASADDRVGARLISPIGEPVGPLISTGIGGPPLVSFGGSEYLVVWQDCDVDCTDNVLGRFISPSGQPSGPAFTIDGSGEVEDITGVGVGGSVFLVAYVKFDPTTAIERVFGRLVASDGSVGDEIGISTGPGDNAVNNVAFGGGSFLVVWVDDDTDSEVVGRFIGLDGTPGAEFTINGSASLSDNPASVLFAGGQFLVAFSDVVIEVPEEFDLFGQRLDTAGTRIGGPFPISAAAGSQFLPFMASNGQTILVTWTDLRSGLQVYGQFLTASGSALGGEFLISTGTESHGISPVSSDGMSYLVAYAEGISLQGDDVEGGDVLGRIIGEPTTATRTVPVPLPPATSPGDTFGSAVDLDGNLLVVGLPGSDLTGTDAGAVAVYRIEGGQPVLDEVVQLPPDFAAAGFGASVAVSGDTLVVGTSGMPTSRKGTVDALAAAVFQRLTTGGWEFKQPLTGNGANGDDGFGASVAIDDDMIVVGAPDDDEDETPGSGSGAAYVFDRENSASDFEPMDKLKPAAADPGAKFGQTVALSDAKIGVGAPKGKPGGGVATGSVTLYEAVADALNEIGTVTGSDTNEGSNFGSSVDINMDGSVIVGSPDEDDAEGPDQGAAYVFSSGGDVITQTHRIKPSDPVAGGRFGAAVAMDGGTIAVGSPMAQNDGVSNGAVYRFGQTGTTVSQSSRQGADSTQSALGAAVSASLERVLAGAPDSGDATGSAVLELEGGPLNSQISGPWFNAGQSGHGWLIELLTGIGPDDPDRVNAYWYVYLNGMPVWLIGTGDVSGSSATLNVVMTRGADFPPDFDSGDVELIPWGTLSFDFAGDGSGTASWDSVLPEFGSGALEMVQLASISGTAASCRSGSYFNPAQNGHGIVVEVVNIGGADQVIVAWYVYLDGEQVWLFGQGPLVGDIAQLPMNIFSGADFPPDFDSGDVVNPPWGTLTIRFTGPNSAEGDWVADFPGYTDGSLEFTRLTELKGRACP